MRSGAGGSGRFTWKTLEEETRELMKQLERLRLQEVTKVKAVMVRAKEEHAKNLLRVDKKKAVLSGQVIKPISLIDNHQGCKKKFQFSGTELLRSISNGTFTTLIIIKLINKKFQIDIGTGGC